MPADRLLTVHQAARRLRRHPETVRRWLRAGSVPEARFERGGWWIPETALDALYTPVVPKPS